MRQKKAKRLAAAALVSCTTFCLLGSMAVEGREGLPGTEEGSVPVLGDILGPNGPESLQKKVSVLPSEGAWKNLPGKDSVLSSGDVWETLSGNNPGNLWEKESESLWGNNLGNLWEKESESLWGNNAGNLLEKESESLSGNDPGNSWGSLPGEGTNSESSMTVSSGDMSAELLHNGTTGLSRGDALEDLLCPSSYAVALNPYRMPVKVREGLVSTEQVISRGYGIVNKSDMEMTVTVSVFIEDLNGGSITFVDSAAEAQNAEDGVYAVYLALIPADGSDIRAGGEKIGKGVSEEELSDVEMTGAYSRALALQEGENRIVFALSDFTSDNGGVTAFTFGGALNENAGWEELDQGIRISVSYHCETVGGTETDADSIEKDMID